MMSYNLLSFFVFCTILALALAIYMAVREQVSGRGRIRSRLTAQNEVRITSEAELFDVRRSRSLTSDGGYAIFVVSLNKLILQSGTRLGLSGVIFAALACAAAAFVVAHLTGFNVLIQILSAIVTGTVFR